MLCLEVRHIGIPSKYHEASTEYYEALGFRTTGAGRDSINGREVMWRKMSDGILTIELIFGEAAEPHIALTVDEIDESKYYYTAPSGHRIQFDRDPSGNLIELVERRSKVEKA